MKIMCPYCAKEAQLVGGNIIYKHRPDLSVKKFWLCSPCDAFVGTHKNSKYNKPLGTLAKPKLRELRRQCHAIFDPLWQKKNLSRTEAYKWLAENLEVPMNKCHIAMFNQAMCIKAIELFKKPDALAIEKVEIDQNFSLEREIVGDYTGYESHLEI